MRARRVSVLALGGEAIGPQLWAQLGSLETTEVHNCYGPTETTVEAAVARVADTATPTIGRATRRMRAAVLDSRLLPHPVGVVGELYLSGAADPRLVSGRPGQTATRFVADPARPGQRMYRTGDLVRWSGEPRIVGRSDDQVKIRGYRIELGEVEAGLRRVPGVRTAAVLTTPRPTGAALVGFVVGAEGPELDAATVRRALGRQVPAHMVPARIVPAGPAHDEQRQTDAKALADSAAAAFADHVDGEKPATDTEHAVAAAIADMLGTAPGVTDDLFDYGLDSIVAMAVVNAPETRGTGLRHETYWRTALFVMPLPPSTERWSRSRRSSPPASTGPSTRCPSSSGCTSTATTAGSRRPLCSPCLPPFPTREVVRCCRPSSMPTTCCALPSSTVRSSPAHRVRWTHNGARRGVGPGLMALITPPRGPPTTGIDPDTGAMLAATWLRAGEATGHRLARHPPHRHRRGELAVLFTDLFEAGLAIAGGATPDVTPEFTDYRRWCRLLTERANSTDVRRTARLLARRRRRDRPCLSDRASPTRPATPGLLLASEIALTEQTSPPRSWRASTVASACGSSSSRR